MPWWPYGLPWWPYGGCHSDHLSHQVNSVYVIFDEPVTVSSVRLWNYTKTTSRGVKEFAVRLFPVLSHKIDVLNV